MPLYKLPTPDVLQRIIVRTMLETREFVLDLLVRDFAEACRATTPHPRWDRHGIKPKQMLYVDQAAEIKAKDLMSRVATDFSVEKDYIKLYGEETLWDEPDLDLSGIDRPVVIVDMIDGSDLVERTLGNWCSAAILFIPSKLKILLGVVQDSHHNLYIANEKGAWFVPVTTEKKPRENPLFFLISHNEHARKLKEPQKHVNQNAATLCFYGQNCEHFTTIPDALMNWMASGPPEDRKEEFAGRVYNLAGNPMMCKMADGEPVHVVFEHHVGQYPHDLVPGAYIAAIAGASMVLQQNEESWAALKGNELIRELARILLRPARKDLRKKYVLAGSMDLAKHYAQYVLPGYKAAQD